MTEQVRTGMSLEDFDRLPERVEYIDGEVIALSPAKVKHAYRANRLAKILLQFLNDHPLGEVFVELPFTMLESSSWVTGSRTPDVSFYTAEGWAVYTSAYPDWEDRIFTLAPDLAVEFVSDNDDLKQVFRKAEGYLADGVQQVWVIDPAAPILYAFAPNRPEILRVRGDETLSGGAILPGFTLDMAALFA
ncbi:MAG: Uma2 family endonuclease [bacterium]|nr:Uma2 family endonuclease [bacterium]